MCVITLVEDSRPTDEQVGQMWDQNPKGGGGVAWREEIDGVPVVRWKKGLNKAEMVRLNNSLPLPYILHFRQPSHDTSDSLLACHPFQVDDDASTGFEGTTTGWVLFHNGFWTGWRTKLESLAVNACRRMPSGAWSDTRGLAWAANILGFGFLEMVNEKVICFGPGPLDVEMFGGPWAKVKVPQTEHTIVVSNTTWERTVTTQVTDRRRVAGYMGPGSSKPDTSRGTEEKAGESGGAPRQGTFPSGDGGAAAAAGTATDQQKRVQTPAEGVVEGGASHGPSGGTGTLVPGKCTGCGKQTSTGTIYLGQLFCIHCWSSASKQQQTAWVGICHKCRVNHSGMKTFLGDEWMCHTCWDTNGHPRIYYAKPANAA